MLLPAASPGAGGLTHAMLEAHQLAARRGTHLLFDDLSLAVAPGRALVISGRNGSGKTTLLRILAGLSEPYAGRVTWQGHDIARHRGHTHADTCFAGHLPALKDELSVTENLRALCALSGAEPDASSLRRALDEVGLERRRHLPARALSQGQRRRVSLARLRLGTQRLWLLDEPATALDAEGLALLASMLAAHLEAGGTVVAATHQSLDLPASRAQSLALA